MSSTIRTDRTLIRPDAHSRRFVLAPLTAPSATRRRRRPALDLAIVLDRSGSMQGPKIELARRAAVEALGRLSRRDRFSLVVYDDQIDVLVSSRSATPAARFEAEALLAGVEPRAATDLAGGWQAGCAALHGDRRRDALARCLLLTDGLANRGVYEPERILAMGAAMRRRGVSTSTFGVGTDFDEALLGGLAEACGGHFYFVERPDQIPAFLSGEVDEVLDVTARDVRLAVEAPPDVQIASLNEYPVETQDGVTRVFLGDLVSNQEIAPVLELRFPRLREGDTADLTLRWESAGQTLDATPTRLTWEVAAHAANDAQQRDRSVDRAVATLYAARARRRAHLLNRAERYPDASQAMRRCAQRIRSYAGEDAALLALAAGLEREAGEYAARIDVLSLKLRYASSRAILKQRTSTGHARRTRVERTEAITVLPTTAPLRSVAEEAVTALAEVEDGFDPPAVLGPAIEVPGRKGALTLNAAAETDLVDRAGAAASGIRIVLTTRRLEDNWFSHWHEQQRVAVVSLHDWDRISALPPEAYVAFEIVHHGLRRDPAYDPASLAHEETRGCLSDFCRTKRSVDAKLTSGGLCAPCRRGLESAGLSLARVEALGRAIATLATRGGVPVL